MDFSIPAVGSVVSHFIVHMLTESQTLTLDTDLDQEHVNTSNEVAQGLVVYDFL